MFDQIVTNLSGLRGVHYASLHKDDQELATSFPSDMAESIGQASSLVEQAFGAIEAIGKSHDEMYFSVEDRYLAMFRLYDSHIAVLLTDKKINFPLIHMGIKSASEKIKQFIEAEEKKKELEAAQAKATTTGTALIVPTNESLLTIFNEYSAVLTSFLGPAARFVVDDCVDQWKHRYLQTPENLGYLVELIQEELDSDEEKEKFAQQVNAIRG